MDNVYLMGTQKVETVGKEAIGKETLTVSSTSTPFAQAPAGAAKALVTVEVASIRFWVDGSAPTASEGHLLNNGDQILLDSPSQISRFRAFATAADATLQITYF